MKKNSILLILGFCTSIALSANPDKMMGHDGKSPWFGTMDANKDGKISKDEWMAHFKEIDTNHDGFITEEEMNKHHEMMGGKMHDHMHDQKK